MSIEKKFEIGFTVLMICFIVLWIIVFIGNILELNDDNKERTEKLNKFIKKAVTVYVVMFLGFGVYMIFSSYIDIEKDHISTNNYYYSQIDTLSKNMGMKPYYSSSKDGFYLKDSLVLKYDEKDDNEYKYEINDKYNKHNEEIEKIVSYFINSNEGTITYINKYLGLCKENEFDSSIIIYSNNTKIEITLDKYENLKYIITKYNKDMTYEPGFIIKKYNLDIDSDIVQLYKKIFGNDSYYKKEERDSYTYYIKQ